MDAAGPLHRDYRQLYHFGKSESGQNTGLALGFSVTAGRWRGDLPALRA